MTDTRRTAGLLLCLGLLARPGVAQPAAEPAPPSEEGGLRDRAERLEQFFKGAASRLHRLGLYPRATSLASGGGPAPGLSYWAPAAGARSLDVYANVSHSFRGDRLLELRLGRIPRRPGEPPLRRDGFEWIPGFVADRSGAGRFFVYGEARQLDLGPGRYLDGASDPLRQDSFDLVAGYRLSPRLSASIRAGFLQVRPGLGAEVLDPAARPLGAGAPGLAWRRDYRRVSSEIAWDSRRRPWRAEAGQFLSLTLDRYDARTGGGFARATLDARHFQPLGSPRHVLALRGLASVADAEGASHVPFYLQATLGGSQILRGYPRHRFAGDRILAFAAEYRFEVVPALELAAFYDAGRAGGGHPSLASDGWRDSLGAGLRLKTREAVLLRLDVAGGGEGTRVHLKFGYSF